MYSCVLYICPYLFPQKLFVRCEMSLVALKLNLALSQTFPPSLCSYLGFAFNLDVIRMLPWCLVASLRRWDKPHESFHAMRFPSTQLWVSPFSYTQPATLLKLLFQDKFFYLCIPFECFSFGVCLAEQNKTKQGKTLTLSTLFFQHLFPRIFSLLLMLLLPIAAQPRTSLPPTKSHFHAISWLCHSLYHHHYFCSTICYHWAHYNLS